MKPRGLERSRGFVFARKQSYGRQFHRAWNCWAVPLLLVRVHVNLEAPMNPRSTAQIADHPIHPMLIPFPIAFFVATFVCDLVFWQTGNAAWAQATLWLLGAGL